MNKEYKKALDLYNKGYLDKAINYCTGVIAKDLKNSSILNLKGLMLYLKGNLEEATTAWKVNYDYNNNQVSKAYLRDTKIDKEKIRIFRDAEEKLKELKITEAIELLEECKKSDFNAIAVNNALAVCYYRKGEFDIARVYITKAFTIDKKNSETLMIKKKLEELNEGNSNKKYVAILLSVVVVIAIPLIFTLKNKDTKSENVIENKGNEVTSDSANQGLSDKDDSEKEDIKPIEEIEEKANLSIEEIEKNYIDASTYFANEKYDDALQVLDKTYKCNTESHLKDDVAFLLASTYEKLNKNNEAIKTYEEYISLDEEGNYIEEAYYKLALLNRDIDLSKAKEYAEKLAYNYTKSIYNNDNIKAIISS